MMVTQERLKEVLSYDPETGLFTWRVQSTRRKVGDIAGSRRDSGHIVIRIDGQLYRAHQLVFLYMTGAWPKGVPDHIYGVKHDNRFSQLRDATPAMNSQNVRDDPTTGVERRPCGSFRAHLTLAGKKLHIGTFAIEADAKAAYLDAKRARHPGFIEGRQFPDGYPAASSSVVGAIGLEPTCPVGQIATGCE